MGDTRVWRVAAADHCQPVGEEAGIIAARGVRPHAIERQSLGNWSEARPAPGQALPEVPLLPDLKLGVEAVRSLHERAADEAAVDRERVVAGQGWERLIGVRQGLLGNERAVLRHASPPTVNE